MQTLLEKYIRSFFPDFSDDDHEILKNLPDKFILESVPYVKQEDKYLSGSAVAQMLFQFYGIPSSPNSTQNNIAINAGWDNYNNFTHVTFKENFSKYIITQGLLSSDYYPQHFIARKLGDGLQATKFIRENSDFISKFDFQLFRLFLYKLRRPLKIRLHFNEDHYPMPEDMLQKIDMSGHCALIVGYDSDGFIFHDPWDRDSWGGTRGGAFTVISYEELMYRFQMVNYSLEAPDPNGTLIVKIPVVQDAVVNNSTIVVKAILEWPGVKGYSLNGIHVNNITASITVGGDLQVHGGVNNIQANQILVPGDYIEVEWQIDTGAGLGSYPIYVTFNGNYVYPAIPWENLTELDYPVSFSAKSRLCVFDSNYLVIAGIV